MNPMVVILISLNLGDNISALKFGMLGHFGDIVLGLPLELKHGILLEEEGDHRDILFICIIGVVHSGCEDS